METTLRHSTRELVAAFHSGSAGQGLAHPETRLFYANLSGVEPDEIVTLRPRPLVWLRKVLVCGWSGFLLVSSWPSPVKLDCCLLSLIVLGTFRTITVSAQQVIWSYQLGFLPFYTSRISLLDQSRIVTSWEERSGLGEALLLGLWGTCVAPLADWLCPWRGGPYRLWVQDRQGMRTLIWRGRVERSFHRNHKLLGQATGMPSVRAPASESQPHWL